VGREWDGCSKKGNECAFCVFPKHIYMYLSMYTTHRDIILHYLFYYAT